MPAMNYLLVALGGATGALARYQVNLLAKQAGMVLPFATLSVNVLGSVFFGFLVVLLMEKSLIDEQLRLLLLVGFAGAFTTFSTFSYEIVSLLQTGQWLNAFFFALANVLLSLMGFALAFYFAKMLVS